MVKVTWQSRTTWPLVRKEESKIQARLYIKGRVYRPKKQLNTVKGYNTITVLRN